MITAKQWDEYNDLGVVDIFEVDPNLKVYLYFEEPIRFGEVFYVHPDRGVFKRELFYESDKGWWHYTDSDVEV